VIRERCVIQCKKLTQTKVASGASAAIDYSTLLSTAAVCAHDRFNSSKLRCCKRTTKAQVTSVPFVDCAH
jgi:hypothetical protein